MQPEATEGVARVSEEVWVFLYSNTFTKLFSMFNPFLGIGTFMHHF